MNEFLTQYAFLIVPIIKIAILVFVVLTVDAYLTWLERKVIAHIQARWGPHRVGPHGLLQPLADGVKFIFKEDPIPANVDKVAYFVAPFITLMLALTSLAVIPFGPQKFTIWGYESTVGIADINISLLVLFAITALGVYGIALAGWGSNSKYSSAGRAAKLGPDDQLRAFADTFGGRRALNCRNIQPARNRNAAR